MQIPENRPFVLCRLFTTAARILQVFFLIRYIHISIIHLVYPPKVLQKHCFLFLLEFTILPRELENNTYAKFWGVNKVYCG